jgi:hypothetical protein
MGGAMGNVLDLREGLARRAWLNAVIAAEKIEKPRGFFFPRSKRIVVTNPVTGEPYCISPCVVPPDWEADAILEWHATVRTVAC